MDWFINILLIVLGLILGAWGIGKSQDAIAKKTADELERRQRKE